MELTLLEKLREVQHFKPGDPMPDWAQPNTWGTYLSQLCGEAADEIERLWTRFDGAS